MAQTHANMVHKFEPHEKIVNTVPAQCAISVKGFELLTFSYGVCNLLHWTTPHSILKVQIYSLYKYIFSY